MKRVLAGIRATSNLHLGNYLGAVKGMLELQKNDEYETFYMVADLHAITTPFNPQSLIKDRYEVVLDYLACGIDPSKSTLFLQSEVPEHAELSFYLASLVTIARMQHLPTFKDKIKESSQGASLALLNYPILMAGDILLYKADLVPVGIDQEPHLEVAREIARKLNQNYNLDFPEPTRFATTGEYVPSLTGEGKMSKSVAGSSIKLTDSLDQISLKLASVPTDSGKGDTIPLSGGVATLLKLIELFVDTNKRKFYEEQYLGEGIRYKELKENLAQVIFDDLLPIQKRRIEYEKDPKKVETIVQEGSVRAGEVAKSNLNEIKKAMGFLSN